jgi:hypothetical protein
MENQHTIISQAKAARIAGFMFLFGMAASILAESLRGALVVRGNVAETALAIMAHEFQFRVALALDLLTYLSVVLLVWSLYILLKPVDRNLALLGAFVRLVEVSFFCVMLVKNFDILHVLGNDDYLKTFEPGQLQALSRLAMRTKGEGYMLGFAILSLGSTIFNYLLFKSHYIPKALAGLGLFSSVLLFTCMFAIIVFPAFGTSVVPFWYIPIFLYEVGLGFWFVTKGVRIPG